MRIDKLVVFRHHLADVFRNGAHFHRIGADDTELHREADRRTEHEAVDAGTRLRHRTVGDRLFQPSLEALPPVQSLSDDHDLREIGVGQLGIEADPEARGTRTHVGRVAPDIRVVPDQLLALLGRRLRHADRRSLRQPHLEEKLGARRGREELLLHQAEAGNARQEHENRCRDHRFATA